MNDNKKNFKKACYEGDITQVQKLLSQGIDLNETNQYGETLFSETAENLMIDEEPWRYQVVKLLLDQGGDPNLLDEVQQGSLTMAMLRMDAEMIELLCEYGAKPNAYAGFLETAEDTLLDWALFEYPYQMGDYRMKLPEEPTEDDKKDADSLIGYFQRMAEKYNLKEPKHLFVLRKFGARTWRELNEGG